MAYPPSPVSDARPSLARLALPEENGRCILFGVVRGIPDAEAVTEADCSGEEGDEDEGAVIMAVTWPWPQ